MAANLKPGSIDEALEERISRLLVGAVDMHCHSGPSVMTRDVRVEICWCAPSMEPWRDTADDPKTVPLSLPPMNL